MSFLDQFVSNIHFIGAFSIFAIGLYIVINHPNLIKRIIGINIMSSGVFYFFVAIGAINNGDVPIVTEGANALDFINPVPSALILTGIVISVSFTVYALSLVIKIHQSYGTLNQEEIVKMTSRDDSYD
jgi:multicomponent Na+:H+ antiporter subunit C